VPPSPPTRFAAGCAAHLWNRGAGVRQVHVVGGLSRNPFPLGARYPKGGYPGGGAMDKRMSGREERRCPDNADNKGSVRMTSAGSKAGYGGPCSGMVDEGMSTASTCSTGLGATRALPRGWHSSLWVITSPLRAGRVASGGAGCPDERCRRAKRHRRAVLVAGQNRRARGSRRDRSRLSVAGSL